MSVYSHPVLRNDTNDILGETNFPIPNMEKNKLLIENATVTDPGIVKMLEQKDAVLIATLENQRAFFSKTFKAENGRFNIDLNSSDYPEGRYLLELYIVANKNLEEYTLTSFHQDFESACFALNEGDIISYLGCCSFQIDKDFGSLNEPETIFEFEPSDDEKIKGRSLVYFAMGKIFIQVYETDIADVLILLKGINVDFLVLAYIVPALIFAVESLKKDQESAALADQVAEYEDERWAISIIELCEKYELNIMQDNSVLIAHTLAKDPIIGSADHLLDLATRSNVADED